MTASPQSRTSEITPAISNLDGCLIRSALGSRPPEIYYEWASLWQMTEKEKADVGLIAAQTITELNGTGLYPQEALAKSGSHALRAGHHARPGRGGGEGWRLARIPGTRRCGPDIP